MTHTDAICEKIEALDVERDLIAVEPDIAWDDFGYASVESADCLDVADLKALVAELKDLRSIANYILKSFYFKGTQVLAMAEEYRTKYQ